MSKQPATNQDTKDGGKVYNIAQLQFFNKGKRHYISKL